MLLFSARYAHDSDSRIRGIMGRFDLYVEEGGGVTSFVARFGDRPEDYRACPMDCASFPAWMEALSNDQ